MGRKKSFSFSNNYLISVKILQPLFGTIEKERIFAIPKRENVLREAQERRLRIRMYLRVVRKLFLIYFQKHLVSSKIVYTFALANRG